MADLLDCPFCGGSDLTELNGSEGIICRTCGVQVLSARTERDIDAWNRRAEAAMAQAPTPTPATWQRRQKYALRCPTVDADPWKECGYNEAMFERQPGYEYRPLYASPPPASEAVKS